MDLLWPRDSRHLTLVLGTLGVADVDGQLFTAERVDAAIQSVMEERRRVEGWSMLPELEGPLRHQVHQDVLAVLEIDQAENYRIADVQVLTRWALGYGADRVVLDNTAALHARRSGMRDLVMQERVVLSSPWTDIS